MNSKVPPVTLVIGDSSPAKGFPGASRCQMMEGSPGSNQSISYSDLENDVIGIV